MDIGARGTPIHRLRLFLSRILTEFQEDLRKLDEGGLERSECDQVKEYLKKISDAFRELSAVPLSAPQEVARHFEKYAKVYADWNGAEGSQQLNVEKRKKEIKSLATSRTVLFRKFASRQKELSLTPELEPFTEILQKFFRTLAENLPDRFPRMRQAMILFVWNDHV
jgi:hypothetical protein